MREINHQDRVNGASYFTPEQLELIHKLLLASYVRSRNRGKCDQLEETIVSVDKELKYIESTQGE